MIEMHWGRPHMTSVREVTHLLLQKGNLLRENVLTCCRYAVQQYEALQRSWLTCLPQDAEVPRLLSIKDAVLSPHTRA